MNLHAVHSASVPLGKRTSLPCGAPAKHPTAGQMLVERRNFYEETLLKEEELQKHKGHPLPEKSAERAKTSVQKVKNKKF